MRKQLKTQAHYWRWLIVGLAALAIILLAGPRLVPFFKLQQQYDATNTDANWHGPITPQIKKLLAESETPYYLHPGDSREATLRIQASDQKSPYLSQVVPKRTLLNSTCRFLSPAFQVIKIEGPRFWYDGSNPAYINAISCRWMISSKQEGKQFVALQMTIGGGNLTQAESIEVRSDPFDLSNISTLLGVVTAAVSLILQLVTRRESP